jgi:polysaccharide export outer membrane protein
MPRCLLCQLLVPLAAVLVPMAVSPVAAQGGAQAGPLSAITPPASTGGRPVAGASAALQAGDVVRIMVWGQPQLTGDFRVAPDGTLGHPLYQAVTVAGVPVDTARARITAYLKEGQGIDHGVFVEPLFLVTVGGEVRSPNLYPLPAGTTMAQAVALAGGATERGRLSKVVLLRQGKRLTVNLTSSAALGPDTPVLSGDQIIVSQKGNIFRDVIGPLSSLTAAAAAIISIASN